MRFNTHSDGLTDGSVTKSHLNHSLAFFQKTRVQSPASTYPHGSSQRSAILVPGIYRLLLASSTKYYIWLLRHTFRQNSQAHTIVIIEPPWVNFMLYLKAAKRLGTTLEAAKNEDRYAVLPYPKVMS